MSKGRGVTRNGRSKKDAIAGPFVALPHSVLDKPEFRGLSSAAKVVVVAIAHVFRGKERTPNGTLAFGERSGAAWGLSAKTTRRALREAEAAGFIRKTQAASFTSKKLMTEWALSWYPTPGNAEAVTIRNVFASGKNAPHRGKNGRYERSVSATTAAVAAVSTAVSDNRRVA